MKKPQNRQIKNSVHAFFPFRGLKAMTLVAAVTTATFLVVSYVSADQELDSDSDGMPNEWESSYGLNPSDSSDANLDADHDGLKNLDEFLSETSPISDDTDGDRLLDGWEIDHGFDPTSGLRPELLGWWRFSGESATTIEDGSGYDNTAEIRATNHVARISGAPVGGALHFDGVVDPSDSTLDGHVVAEGIAEHSLSNAFTVAAWVRPDSFTAYSPVFSKMTSPDAWDDGFAVYTLGSGAFGAFVRSFGDPTNLLTTASSAVTNEWHHLCLVYDGFESILYVDGVEASASTNATGSVVNEAPLVIGSLVGSAGTRPWHGDIADARLYSAALSQAEIDALLETYADSDGDGLDNLQEQDFGSDPHNADSDGDGLSDALELEYGTNPLSADSDGDGLPDTDEIRLGRDPLAAGAATTTSILSVHTPME